MHGAGLVEGEGGCARVRPLAIRSRFVRACKPPAMRNSTRYTWDKMTVILMDGATVRGVVETSWGCNFYFEYERKWYRVPLFNQYNEKPWPHHEAPGASHAFVADLRKLADAPRVGSAAP